MEEWKNRHPHTFIGIMTQELLRSVEENELTQTKDIGNQIQVLNTVAEENHKKLENDLATLKKELDENKAQIAKLEAEKKDQDQTSETSMKLNEENKIEEKNTKAENLVIHLKNFISRFKGSEENSESLQKELDENKSKIAGLETEKEDHDKNPESFDNLVGLRQDCNETANKLKDTKIKDLQKEVEDLTSKLMDSEDRYESVKKLLDEDSSMKVKRQEELQHHQESFEKLAFEKKSLEKTLEAFKSDFKRKEKELKDKLVGNKVRISILENENSDLKLKIRKQKDKFLTETMQMKAKHREIENESNKENKTKMELFEKDSKKCQAEKLTNQDLEAKSNSMNFEIKTLKSEVQSQSMLQLLKSQNDSKDNSKNDSKGFELNAAFIELSTNEDEPSNGTSECSCSEVHDATNDTSYFRVVNDTVIENPRAKTE